jgi:transcriptional regulator with XRE-family HTH domain
MSVSEQVAANVRAALGRANQTQAALAAALGMGRPALHRRFSGAIPFNVDELWRISKFTGVPYRDLVLVHYEDEEGL